MKNYTLLLIIVLLNWACSDSIGSSPFDENEENEFSVFLAEVGTFNFKQNYSPTVEPDDITTSLRILSDSTEVETLMVELLAFKSDTLKFNHLAFTFRDTITKNQNNYRTLDQNGGDLLSENRVKISIINTLSDSTNISGHYEGICKITTINDVGTDNEADGEVIIFNMYGNINANNNLLLFPVDSLTNIDYITGTYASNHEFTGTVYKNNVQTGSITNNTTDFLFSTDADMIVSLSDTLSIVTTTNVTKKLTLTLQKID